MSKWRKTNRAKRVSHSCGNHGSCPWCHGNRTKQERRARQAAEAQVREFEEESNAER